MSLLFYRRPDFIKKPDGPMDVMSCQRIVARQLPNKKFIPESVSFDRIIEDRTLPPCSLSDFMDYLVYVAYEGENLQFFMWYKNYVKRFNELNDAARSLSPPVEVLVGQNTTTTAEPAVSEKGSEKSSEDITVPDFDKVPSKSSDFPIPQTLLKHPEQPFRDEVNRIAAHYIAPSAPRELNLSHKDRILVLRALEDSTHPSVFAGVAELIELTLRNSSHPNFIRWTICNGNKPKVVMARSMATFMLSAGILISVFLCLSGKARWWRIFAFLPFFLCILIYVASYKGICLILHAAGGTRDVKPWESMESVNTAKEEEERIGVKGSSDSKSQMSNFSGKSMKSKWLDAFGRSNDFEDEAWVTKWKQRPLFRRILVERTKIKDEGIKFMMNKIVLQSQAWAFIGALIITVAIVAIPEGHII